MCLFKCKLLINYIFSQVVQDSDDSDVVITGIQLGRACPASLCRVEDLKTTVLNPNCWLDDNAVDHSQALLQAQHPDVGGLYATTSLALLSSVPAPTQGFVQILNVCGNHWVTVSNIGCQVGTVNVYDSSGHSTTEELISQITGLLFFTGNQVRLQWPDVQQQRGGSDCGLFAIANSLTLCRGEDPSMVQYHQAAMRKHLFSCFQMGHLKPFPCSTRCPTVRPVYAMEVSIHCSCRRTIREGGDEPLLSCRRCGKVFHLSCLPDRVDLSEFVCSSCKVVF